MFRKHLTARAQVVRRDFKCSRVDVNDHELSGTLVGDERTNLSRIDFLAASCNFLGGILLPDHGVLRFGVL